MDNVYIVEDHELLRSEWVFFLNNVGLSTRGTNCGLGLDDLIAAHGLPQAVVLDINLPGEDGFSIAERLRQAHPQLVIVILTAHTSAQDQVRGYAIGANAYLTKPFPAEHLRSILETFIQRGLPTDSNKWQLNASTSVLTTPSGLKTLLTDKEVAIIEHLSRSRHQHAAHDDLLLLFAQDDVERDKSYLHNLMSRLRIKLDQINDGEPSIRTIRNLGYSLLIGVSILY